MKIEVQVERLHETISSQQSNSFDTINMTTVTVPTNGNDAESEPISESDILQRSPVNYYTDALRNVS